MRKIFHNHFRLKLLGIYLAVLFISHLSIFLLPPPKSLPNTKKTLIPTSQGTLAAQTWGHSKHPCIIAISGSPGQGAQDWKNFAPALAQKGYFIIGVDRWGYGHSTHQVDDYSFASDSRALLSIANHFQQKQYSLLGWSYGGAVSLHHAYHYPLNVQQVILIGGLGIQEGEGSGNYWIEHIKYAILWAGIKATHYLVPHFGLLHQNRSSQSFARDFWDSDQRPIKDWLPQIKIPALILQGQYDPLVTAWTAEKHHQLLPNSQLQIYPASHFFPFGPSNHPIFQNSIQDIDLWFREKKLSPQKWSPPQKLGGIGPPIRGKLPWLLLCPFLLLTLRISPRWTYFLTSLFGAWLAFDLITGLGIIIIGSFFLKKKSWRIWFALCLAGLITGSLCLSQLG